VDADLPVILPNLLGFKNDLAVLVGHAAEYNLSSRYGLAQAHYATFRWPTTGARGRLGHWTGRLGLAGSPSPGFCGERLFLPHALASLVAAHRADRSAVADTMARCFAGIRDEEIGSRTRIATPRRPQCPPYKAKSNKLRSLANPIRMVSTYRRFLLACALLE
jgi:hypothetical protein